MLFEHPQKQQDIADRRRAAWISLVASVLLLGLKGGAAWITGSTAVLSDALESIVNVVTAAVALGVIRFASEPADREHPYGHGKAEFVSAAFEGGLIVFAAIAISLEAFRSLWQGAELRELDLGLALVAAAAAANLVLGLYLRRVSRRANSETLAASSAHVLSDVKTTAGVLLALFLVRITGWTWIDPVLAVIVAGMLAWEGVRIVRRSFSGLIDATDVDSLEVLAQAIRQHRRPGVIEIHHLRAIRSGSFHHIDAHLVVPEFWDVVGVHDMTEDFERKVVADYPYDGEIAFHADPCRRKFCRVCDVAHCPVRQAPFEKLVDFNVANMIGDALVPQR